MYTVYILQDQNGKLYKGLMNNLRRRLAEHRLGKTRTTSRMRNIRLAYKEEHSSFEQARKRELYLKTAAGRRFIKTLGL